MGQALARVIHNNCLSPKCSPANEMEKHMGTYMHVTCIHNYRK